LIDLVVIEPHRPAIFVGRFFLLLPFLRSGSKISAMQREQTIASAAIHAIVGFMPRSAILLKADVVSWAKMSQQAKWSFAKITLRDGHRDAGSGAVHYVYSCS